jgi:hypothetical protein
VRTGQSGATTLSFAARQQRQHVGAGVDAAPRHRRYGRSSTTTAEDEVDA